MVKIVYTQGRKKYWNVNRIVKNSFHWGIELE